MQGNWVTARIFVGCKNFSTCKISQVANFCNTVNFYNLRKLAVLQNRLLRTVHFSTLRHCSCYPFEFFTFVPLFGFLPILSPIIAFGYGFFCNFSLAGAVSKLLVHCNTIPFFRSLIIFLGENLSAVPAFSPVSLIFSHFLSLFLGCQTPSEDDNSEDEWLETLPP